MKTLKIVCNNQNGNEHTKYCWTKKLGARIKWNVRISGMLKVIHSAIAFLKPSHGKRNKSRKKARPKKSAANVFIRSTMHCYLISFEWLSEDSTKPNQIQSAWTREADCFNFKCICVLLYRETVVTLCVWTTYSFVNKLIHTFMSLN